MRHSLVALAVSLLAIALSPARVAQAQVEPEPGLEEAVEDDAAAEDAVAEEAPPDAAPTPAPARTRRQPKEGIEEIVVQAGESDASADLEAGDSVTGFDASDLEALGAQSIEDIAGYTPNLEIVTTGATTPTFFIRGVGLNDFGANSTGAVAIYQDDVPKNAPAIQLSTLFDVEAVNVLRGPQGTGPARNASAGAIKIYARKPSGEFGGFLRSEIGNYSSRDFEGAVEAPLYEDFLSGRFAFRYSTRDGWMENRCGSNPRQTGPYLGPEAQNRNLVKFGGYSTCGERVFRQGYSQATNVNGKSMQDGFSAVPAGLPSEMNDRGTWATRAMLRFQPTLDQDWLLGFNLSKRNELSEVGQSHGTGAIVVRDAPGCNVAATTGSPSECQIGAYGGPDGQIAFGSDASGYQPIELVQATNRLINQLAPACQPNPNLQDAQVSPACTVTIRRAATNAALLTIARDLVHDSLPFEGDFNRAGRVTNDVWGLSLKGDIAVGDSMTLTTVTGWDQYDRYNDVDLDFSPNTLFEILTDDEGWQFVEDIRLSGTLPGELPVGWELGGFTLIEQLDAFVDITLPHASQLFAVTSRYWTQELYSAGGYASFDWDFWDDFTLDGGVRYNWEKKTLDMLTLGNGVRPDSVASPENRGTGTRVEDPNDASDIWQSPTGTIRLTYRFREDTHAYWKYSRGWKGGHYNTTVSGAASDSGITTAEPEKIDSFEVGMRGSWFNGRLGLDTSLFHYAYQDYQIFTVVIPLTGVPEFQVLNASDAEVYGAEIDLTARPLTGMFLQARLGWLESQFIDFKQQQVQIQTIGNQKVSTLRELDFSGNPLLNSPKFKLSLTAEQTLPLGRLGSLTFRWDGAWSDDTYYDASAGKGTPTFDGVDIFPETTFGQEAFWLHNFRLGYRTPDGSVELAAWVRNATDEVYKTYAFDVSGITVNSTTIHFLGEPRTYGLSLNVSF